MLTINEDMEEDIDDSDYLGTSDEEGSGTFEDDTSLVNEQDMEAELEVLGSLPWGFCHAKILSLSF